MNTSLMRIWPVLLLVFVGASTTQTTQPAGDEAFKKKAIYHGREKGPYSKAEKKGSPVQVHVLKRDDEKITFNYYHASDDGRRGVQLEGTLVNGEIKAKVTKVLPGDTWRETMNGAYFTGKVSGNAVTLHRKSSRGAALTAELTLQEKGKEKD
jgi:hypothetical protein